MQNNSEPKDSSKNELLKQAREDNPLIIKIKELIDFSGNDSSSFDADLVSQMIYTSIKSLTEGQDTGQIKLMTRAFKEIRYAYHIFSQYKSGQMISIFGSARTPEHHPDYIAAKDFSSKMCSLGWICITGAADGIMKAGLEGSHRDSSFGLSIRLPFEIPSHSYLVGDPKLITFRYFFSRKLMFLSHSSAVAAFPGGFGTLDELFEVLTLIQTGKASILPVVLIEGEQEDYWQAWERYVEDHLLNAGLISKEDKNLYYIAPSIEKGVEHILKFYRRYHSSRYVKDTLVIRLKQPLDQEQIDSLNRDFKALVQTGVIYATKPFPEETDHLELSRIAFEHNRKHFGLLRKLIDRINE